MPGGLPGAETATAELVPPDGSLASGEVARSLQDAGGTTEERGNAGRPGPSHAEGGVALPQKTLLDVCLAARAHTPLQQQLPIIESFVAGIEEELCAPLPCTPNNPLPFRCVSWWKSLYCYSWYHLVA